MGIDASTHTIAYCIFDGESPVEWGEINFDGGDVYQRILDAKKKVRALKKHFNTERIITCKSKEKFHHCRPGDILIDDFLKYRHLWEGAGGIFIHHTNMDNSILFAKSILDVK